MYYITMSALSHFLVLLVIIFNVSAFIDVHACVAKPHYLRPRKLIQSNVIPTFQDNLSQAKNVAEAKDLVAVERYPMDLQSSAETPVRFKDLKKDDRVKLAIFLRLEDPDTLSTSICLLEEQLLSMRPLLKESKGDGLLNVLTVMRELQKEIALLRSQDDVIVPRAVYGYVLGTRSSKPTNSKVSKPKFETSSSDFVTFSRNDIKYVDKTKFIKILVKERRAIFLRPRRFGKSLTLSMLKSFWSGHTDLFKNCEVFKEEIKSPVNDFVWSPSNPSNHYFPPCPVIHLDLSGYEPSKSFEDYLSSQLIFVAKQYGVEEKLCSIVGPALKLDVLIRTLCGLPWNKWLKCVILIDEYDSPLHLCHTDEQKKEIIEIIADFFRTIKQADANIAHAYVTGISSYGLAGLYSGTNNFINLSLNPALDTLCGFTKEEVVDLLDKNIETDHAELEDLRKAYNGYTWNVEATEATPRVYNPFEIITYAKQKEIVSYFCASSHQPLFYTFPELVFLKLPVDAPESLLYQPLVIAPSTLQIEEVVINQPVGVTLAIHLLEAGYATIKNSCSSTRSVSLDFPNELVETYVKSQITALVNSEQHTSTVNFLADNGIFALFEWANKVRGVVPAKHRSLFDSESGWHVLLTNMLTILNAHFITEEGSSKGFSDLIVETPKCMYVIEIKKIPKGSEVTRRAVKKLGDVALTQISDRKYAKKSTFIRDLIANGRKVEEIIEVGLVASDELLVACTYRPYTSTGKLKFKAIVNPLTD